MVDRSPNIEFQLWQNWDKQRDSNSLNALLDYMEPTIRSKVNTLRSAPVPESAIELEAKKWALKSFETYDPNRGAKLSTHTTNWLKKVNRFVYNRQNIGYIPEERIIKIKTFQNTKADLEVKLDREPSQVELADELVWSLGEVERMDKELRKDIAPTDTMVDFGYITSDPNREILNYIYFELSPQEQQVYDYTIGSHGKQKMSGNDIAKKLNVSPSQISQIKRRIGEKMERYRK